MEVGFKCPIPHCTHEAPSLEIHHINENPSNNEYENLIALCPTHHSMVTRGIIDRKSVKLFKGLLIGTIDRKTQSENEFLSKREFHKQSKAFLDKKVLPFRTTFVGPMFLHPDWLFDLNQKKKSGVGYDRSIFEFIKSIDERDSSDIKIICRNNNRYKKIVSELVPQDKFELFKQQTLERVDEIWRKDRLVSPLICCVDTGFLQIPTIHDDVLFMTYRKTETTPIGETLAVRDVSFVEKQKKMFDEVFETSFRGIDVELESLKAFIREL